MCAVAASSFFSGKSWNNVLYAATGGVEKKGNWAKPGLGELLQQSLCLSFLIPIFSFALPEFQCG